jgi:hypothetical protein
MTKDIQVIKNSGNNARSVVYTALFGNYDCHDDPKEDCENIDYICFTDCVRDGSKWTQIKVDIGDLSCVVANRFFKMHPHLFFTGYEFTIYVDANMLIKKCPCSLLLKIPLSTPFAAFAHPVRNTLLFEGLACVVYGKSSLLDTTREISKYFKLGYVERNNLTVNNILFVRQYDSSIVDLMEFWWILFGTFTKRDQISLPFCLWKLDVKFKRFSNTDDDISAYFSFKSHRSYSEKTKLDKFLIKLILLKRFVLLTPIYFIIIFLYSISKGKGLKK